MRSTDPTPLRFPRLAIALALTLASSPALAHAQDDEEDDVLLEEEEASPEGEGDDEDYDDEDYDDEEYEDEGDLQLRAPSLGMPDVGSGEGDAGEEDEAEGDDYEDEGGDEEWDETEPVEDDADLLDEVAPLPSADPTVGSWEAPRSTFSIHGYFRLRGELQDNFFLGQATRPGVADFIGNPDGDPTFAYWVPADRGVNLEGTPDRTGGTDRLRYGTMRLRVQPTLALSDDVRVHVTLDVFDNLVLGSTP